MVKDFHSRKSLDDFTDRELLLFILGNQVNLYRRTQYLEQAIKKTEDESLGMYEETFKELIQDVDDILSQAGEHLEKEDEDKGFLKF